MPAGRRGTLPQTAVTAIPVIPAKLLTHVLETGVTATVRRLGGAGQCLVVEGDKGLCPHVGLLVLRGWSYSYEYHACYWPLRVRRTRRTA